MEWVVTTGKTVDEAKEAALDELGVDSVDAEFEVLEEPRQGLFGRQRGEARVRARVRPTAPRPKLDRRDRRRRGRDGGSAGPNGEPATGQEPAEPRPGDGEDGAAGSDGPGGRRRRRSRSRAGQGRIASDRGSGAGGASTKTAEPRDGGPITERGDAVEEERSLAEQGEMAREFVVGLLDRFGTDAEVSVLVVDDDTVEVRVEGDELGLFIGPKGQTLAAIQDLARTVVQRRMTARTGRLVVDIAGYRQKRRQALERFTRVVAAEVVASGAQKVLEPMSPADRKVVHDTANDIDGVKTTSEGEEPRRRVVIMPDTP